MKTFALIILIFPLIVFGQKIAPKSTPKPLTEKEQKLLSQKIQAVSMVEKTAEEAVFWEDKKTAIEVMTEAADLLWNENAGKSAKWLIKAWKIIDEIEEKPKNEKLREYFTWSDKTDLQTKILSVAQKHDANLAEKLLKQLSEKDSTDKKDKGAFDDKTARSEQLLRLAWQVIETNPDLAFSLAERSLVDGISYSLQNVLTDLRKKDVNLANRLFDLALARFNNGVPDTSEAQVLVGYLFKSGFTFSTNTTGQTILVVNPAQQNLPAVAISEPQRTRNFLSAISQAFFTRPIVLSTENRRNAENILLLGKQILEHYDKFALDLSPPTKAFLILLQKQLYPNSENNSSKNDSNLKSLSKDATKEEIYDAIIKDLEEKADKENDQFAKKLAYTKAALATKAEDYKRGVKIAKKIEDETLREDAVSFLLYRAALNFVNEKEIEQAEEIAPQISETLRRSVVKIAIAQFLLKPKTDKKVEQFQINLEKQRAFYLLNDVERDLRKEDISANLVKIMFGKTAVLAEFDKAQSFNSLEQTIQTINKLSKFDLKTISAPNLGLEVSTVSNATVSTPRIGFGFSNSIGLLIESDFEQVVSIVETLSIKEVRGVGRMETAKLFFQKNKNLLNQK